MLIIYASTLERPSGGASNLAKRCLPHLLLQATHPHHVNGTMTWCMLRRLRTISMTETGRKRASHNRGNPSHILPHAALP